MERLAQESGNAAVERLKFLEGNWTCVVHIGGFTGRDDVKYAFSPDGLWMTETSQNKNERLWGLQVWGYDTHARKLVAYNFAKDGVHTKTVDGWVNGEFVSTRDDNGLVVKLRPVSNGSMLWIVESPEGRTVTREDCTRK